MIWELQICSEQYIWVCFSLKGMIRYLNIVGIYNSSHMDYILYIILCSCYCWSLRAPVTNIFHDDDRTLILMWTIPSLFSGFMCSFYISYRETHFIYFYPCFKAAVKTETDRETLFPPVGHNCIICHEVGRTQKQNE